MSPVRFYLFVLILSSPVLVLAGDDEMPSLELLEFLAEWSAEDQAWLDQEAEARDALQVEVEDE